MNGFCWILECRYVWRWWRFHYRYFNRIIFSLNVFLSEGCLELNFAKLVKC
ncbi:hypothetical protein CSB93_0736 [Pseudomonas paraeruginosa]|uniref:Uncharacterized protein n=1 Tax=Pseudomonas paraeruginosa TaxID=2994495 RepID=A0A2R3IXM5_9PSED|nr:hypothetical protein CSB93_0736 [Pseudomonas paraeruginosa]